MKPADFPEDLRVLVSPDSEEDLAVVISSIDRAGYPHFSLLSTFEIFVLGDSLFCTLREGTTAASNFAERSKGSLAFLRGARVIYLKVAAAEVLRLAGYRVFLLTVTSLKIDRPAGEEAGAGLARALLFQEEPASRELRRSARRQIIEALNRKP